MRRYVAFTPIRKEETWIGERLATVRRRHRISQAALARLTGITRDQINNVEIGRVALRFHAGWECCLQLDVNPWWLATGLGGENGFVDMSGVDEIPADTLFSEVAGTFGDEYEAYRKSRLKIATDANVLSNSAGSVVKSSLTSSPKSEIHRPVTWRELRKRLKDATAARGGKSALARAARVSRQVVNAWLSGDGTPNADKTLFLLQWVEKEEGQQKQSGARVEARTPRKTRVSKQRNEDTDSDRKQK